MLLLGKKLSYYQKNAPVLTFRLDKHFPGNEADLGEKLSFK